MALFCGTRNDTGPAAGTDDPYRINVKIQWICSMSAVRGPPSVPVTDNPDSPPPRDFAFTLGLALQFGVVLSTFASAVVVRAMRAKSRRSKRLSNCWRHPGCRAWGPV